MSSSSPRVILTCFAGRKHNLDILLRYAAKLHELGHLHEVHLWNFTRNQTDDYYLKLNFPAAVDTQLCAGGERLCDATTITTSEHVYEAIPPRLTASRPVSLAFLAAGDAHVLLKDGNQTVAEVCIGGWNNTLSVARSVQQGPALAESSSLLCNPSAWTQIGLQIDPSREHVSVTHGGDRVFSVPLPADRQDAELTVNVAGWHNQPVVWNWGEPEKPEPPSAPHSRSPSASYIRVFDVRNKKSWLEYYKHYTKERYPDHVIIKCDDDIGFIDVEAFPDFIARRLANPGYLLAFPSTVNNGVSAHYQQQAGLIPTSIGTFPYDTFNGKLLNDGRMCQKLHQYFVDNHEQWLATTKSTSDPIHGHPIGDRFSINFFAILSKDLPVYQQIGFDDEKDLSITMSRVHRRPHYIDMGMTVAHTAFCTQRAGMDELHVLKEYAKLATARGA